MLGYWELRLGREDRQVSVWANKPRLWVMNETCILLESLGPGESTHFGIVLQDRGGTNCQQSLLEGCLHLSCHEPTQSSTQPGESPRETFAGAGSGDLASGQHVVRGRRVLLRHTAPEFSPLHFHAELLLASGNEIYSFSSFAFFLKIIFWNIV